MTANVGSHCIKCDKQNGVAKCVGCLQDFCQNDFGNHRQELHKQLDEIENGCGLIQKSLDEKTQGSEQHQLIEEIDQWEQNSINKIKQTAEKTRQIFLNYTFRYLSELELKLKNLIDQLKQSRQENDFVEKNLNEWNKQLIQLKEELTQPGAFKLDYDSPALITKIYADLPRKLI